MAFKDYAASEWSYWMKELAEGRRVPGWFKRNVENVGDTMRAYERDRVGTTIAAVEGSVISHEKARELMGATPKEVIDKALANIKAEPTGVVGMFDGLEVED